MGLSRSSMMKYIRGCLSQVCHFECVLIIPCFSVVKRYKTVYLFLSSPAGKPTSCTSFCPGNVDTFPILFLMLFTRHIQISYAPESLAWSASEWVAWFSPDYSVYSLKTAFLSLNNSSYEYT